MKENELDPVGQQRPPESAGWARPGSEDEYGNLACRACGEMQSPRFNSCIKCCQHDNLDLIERWEGPDDGGGWELDVKCVACGKNFGFSHDELMEKYKLVRRCK